MCLGGLLIRGRPRQVVAELLRDDGCVRASVAPLPCGTLPSRGVCRLGSCSVCGLSYPQPPDRSPHWCTVATTGTHPCDAPIQAGRWERQSASSFARGLRGCASGCCRTCAVVVVFPSKSCVCPHSSSTDSLWRGCRATSQTSPVSSYGMMHSCCCCCCSRRWICSPWRLVVLRLLVRATVQQYLLTLRIQTPLGWLMRLNTRAMSVQGFGVVQTASVESPSFHAVSLVTVRPVKYGVSSLTDFVCERLHC